MPNTPPAKIGGEITKQTTRPLWFMRIEFATPLLLCSRETVTIDGDVFTHATLEFSFSGRGSFLLVNENLQFTQFLNEKAPGRGITIWQSYGEAPFTYVDLSVKFKGVVDAGQVGRRISYALRRGQPQKTPFLTIAPPLCNYVPPNGTTYNTKQGPVKINRRS